MCSIHLHISVVGEYKYWSVNYYRNQASNRAGDIVPDEVYSTNHTHTVIAY